MKIIYHCFAFENTILSEQGREDQIIMFILIKMQNVKFLKRDLKKELILIVILSILSELQIPIISIKITPFIENAYVTVAYNFKFLYYYILSYDRITNTLYPILRKRPISSKYKFLTLIQFFQYLFFFSLLELEFFFKFRSLKYWYWNIYQLLTIKSSQFRNFH